MTYSRRFRISVVIWAVALAGWISILALTRVTMGSTSCELTEGHSIYGEASWSWMPPGVHCVWPKSETGFDIRIEEPPPVARLGIAIAFLLWGITLVLLRPRSADAAQPSDTS